MIDTHAHLETLCDIDKGVDKIILAASNIASSKNNLILVEKCSEKLLVSVGIHPMESQESPAELEKIIKKNCKKITAIGECGLDFSQKFDKERQIIVFKKQIELAKKYKLPLIIHARKAVDEVVEILKEYKNLTGVFHCYAGGIKRIKKILELGENWYFGIDGNLTYEVGLEEVIKNIPKDRLVLETDSPYLTPVPFKGEVNSPKNVEYIYKKVAEIWEISFKETEKIIDENAKKLFNIV
ncbi:MAG TPA: TatD family hydrolase [Candidatus Woesebacteria bacterium]|nr:TatD family hydrolase [Candidatus Woesebacteria bacterium]